MAAVCSMIAQLGRLLDRLKAFGSSSRLAQSRGSKSLAIRSIGRHKRLLRSLSSYLRHASEKTGVRQWKQLRPHHAESWIADAKPSTQKTRIEDLRWFQRAVRQELRLHLKLMPTVAPVQREQTEAGHFTSEEAAAIIARAYSSRNPALGAALEFGASLGLRPSEIVAVKAGAYDSTSGVLRVPAIKWSHGREVTVLESLREGLGQLAAGKKPDARLFPDVSTRGMERIVDRALAEMGKPDDPRSVMAFRSTFAQTIYKAARESGLDDADARRQGAEQLGQGHPIRRRIDVIRDHYGAGGDANK